jgi:hypothetical protein
MSIEGRLTRLAAIIAGILALGARVLPSLPNPSPQPAPGAASGFTAHTIDTGVTGGYQVVVTDLNRDGMPDVLVVASGLSELRWYENPGWQRHVLATGINRPINAGAHDVDGDGIPEIGLAHEFAAVYANSPGVISVLTHQGDPTNPWSIREIDRVPTSHRLRFADVTGTGAKVLVNFPLIGSKALAPDYRDHVPLVAYRPPEWRREMISDADEGVVHGILVTPWDNDRHESVLSASFRGVHAHQFQKGQWTRTPVISGDPAPWPKSGASDVAVGRIGRERFLATIEPWHGNTVAVYRRDGNGWKRHVVDAAITDGHTIAAADFDGDGRDEIVVGERQGQRSTYLYRVTDAKNDTWSKEVLDSGMAASGCAIADLNKDKKVDVVCTGSSTANVKWYENRHGR